MTAPPRSPAPSQTLDSQIAATQAQLATSETNNAFLTAELQKQMAQRAELEHKFNDLDIVRAQVKKLRDEAFVARRLQWMNAGTSPGTQPKGAQLLMQHTALREHSAAHRNMISTSRSAPTVRSTSFRRPPIHRHSDGFVLAGQIPP